MYCRHCGKRLADDCAFCPHCGKASAGNIFATDEHSDVHNGIADPPREECALEQDPEFHCPRCKSYNLSPVVETCETVSGKNANRHAPRQPA